MKRTFVLVICSAICAIGAVGCGLLFDDPLRDPLCVDLFRRETPPGDSIPGDPHTPPEAEATSPLYVTPQPMATPPPEVDCRRALVAMPVELVAGVPGNLRSFFRLSPSGRYIAIQQYTEDRLTVLDQITGELRDFTAPGVAFFWTDDLHLFMYDSASDSDRGWYSINTKTGDITTFESRWEYDKPDLSRFSRELYTGWQAASALQVRGEVICKAVREGVLHPISAADGSLLLHRDELLERGVDLVRGEYSDLISSQEVTRLRESASDAVVVARFWRDAPLEYGYENKTWQRLLILTGLPEEPRNLLVHVASDVHWVDYPLIPNQERIAGGAVRARDLHSDYFVSTDLCASGTDEVFVLFAKHGDGETLTALGSIPYEDYLMYNQQGNRSEMVWSPDGGFIYIDKWLSGQYSIYRLQLPKQGNGLFIPPPFAAAGPDLAVRNGSTR